MNYVADLLKMPRIRIYEVATFYTMFNRYLKVYYVSILSLVVFILTVVSSVYKKLFCTS